MSLIFCMTVTQLEHHSCMHALCQCLINPVSIGWMEGRCAIPRMCSARSIGCAVTKLDLPYNHKCIDSTNIQCEKLIYNAFSRISINPFLWIVTQISDNFMCIFQNCENTGHKAVPGRVDTGRGTSDENKGRSPIIRDAWSAWHRPSRIVPCITFYVFYHVLVITRYRL